MDARKDSRLVRLYYKGSLIKTHPVVLPGKRSTDYTDYPKEKTPYAMRSCTYNIDKAEEIGSSCKAFMELLLEGDFPWAHLRQAQKLLRLPEKYLQKRKGKPERELRRSNDVSINWIVSTRRMRNVRCTSGEEGITEWNFFTGSYAVVMQRRPYGTELMMRQSTKRTGMAVIAALWPSVAYADVVWPAIYVFGSYFRFWHIAVIGFSLEAVVLRWRLIPELRKALLISFVANAFSATVGLYLLTFGMLGWHLIIDNFVTGTFALFNRITTIITMLLGSAFLETLIVRAIWKYSLRQTFFVFILGNVLSYGVIAADLFIFGGWHRQM